MAPPRPPEFRADDPELIAAVRERLQTARVDSMWFAIGTVVFTPLAILGSVFVLILAVEWFGLSSPMDDDTGWRGTVSLVVPNLAVLVLLVKAGRGVWGSVWTRAGFAVFAVMLALCVGSVFTEVHELLFVALWCTLAIVALTLTSQAYQDTMDDPDNVVAVIPNAVISAYRSLLTDLWFRDRGGIDVARAIAMLNAVARRDRRKQDRLLAAAWARGIDLRARLISAKLVREYKDELRLGDGLPAAFTESAVG